jgi:L-lactate dehydrogenase complex protein LldG
MTKKTCDDWKQHFPAGKFGAHLFPEFEMRAKAVSAEVFRVKTTAEATEVVLNLARFTNAKKVVAVSNPLQEEAGIEEALKSAGIEVFSDQGDIAAHAATADIGISGVEFGIAETGSLCQDGYAIESRLVSTLPPIHVAFLDSNFIVPGIIEAFAIISQVFDRGYISFITGPSRTADIERVLTIGVHGPSRLVIVAVDGEPQEGGNKS